MTKKNLVIAPFGHFLRSRAPQRGNLIVKGFLLRDCFVTSFLVMTANYLVS